MILKATVIINHGRISMITSLNPNPNQDAIHSVDMITTAIHKRTMEIDK